MFKRGRELVDTEPAAETSGVVVKEVPKDEVGAYEVQFTGTFIGDKTETVTFRVLADSRDDAIFVAGGWLWSLVGNDEVTSVPQQNDMTIFDAIAGPNPVRVSGVTCAMTASQASKIVSDLGLGDLFG